jgi:uncharacterized DUF497 family protein
VEFEWDLSEEMENVQKHGNSFLEAVESFSDPDGFQLEDTKHSQTEARFLGGQVQIRENTHDAVHAPRRFNPDFWNSLLAKIREVLP